MRDVKFYREEGLMKKYILITLSLFIFALAGCSKKEQDPYKSFRGYSSTTLFEMGEKALSKNNYARGVKYLEALDALYPFGPYAEQGQVEIIYAYYMNGDYAMAITAAERYIRLYPRGRYVDYAYYMRGMVGLNLGLTWLQRKVGISPSMRDVSNLQQSYGAFALLVEQFPDSHYTPDALVRMAYIRNLLAARELDIAEFYMDRHAYVAAANRAGVVVQHYQGSPVVQDALVIMVKSYRELGLQRLADDSLRILEANYPLSPKLKYLK